MKSAIFAAALLLGGTALAQDYPDPVTTDPAPPPADTVMPTMAPDTATMPAAAAAATGQTVAPGNTAPEHDARGIAVISDPATAPAGFNQLPAVAGTGGPYIAPQGAPPTEPATESYPACTRQVTDNCVQTYERGRAPQ